MVEYSPLKTKSKTCQCHCTVSVEKVSIGVEVGKKFQGTPPSEPPIFWFRVLLKNIKTLRFLIENPFGEISTASDTIFLNILLHFRHMIHRISGHSPAKMPHFGGTALPVSSSVYNATPFALGSKARLKSYTFYL